MKNIVRLILISLSLVSLSYGMNSMPANALELELIKAARVGNLAQVQILTSNPAVNINAKNNDGSTALSAAAHNGHKEVVKMLLAAGADIHTQANSDDYDCTALFWAAYKGHKEVVEMLLAAEAKTNANCTPLPWAAQNGYKGIVKILLAAGADVNAKSIHNMTALHWAAHNGHKEVVEMLINFNAEIPQELLVRPLVIEAKKNQQLLLHAPHFKAIAKLLSKGSYANAAVRERVRIKRDQLLEAVKKDNVEEVMALLKEGFSLNTCGKDGNTLIHLTIMHNSQQVLGLLLSLYTKQDNNKLWSRKNKLGLTPVEIAVSQGNVELLKSLLTTQEPENSALQESKAWFATNIMNFTPANALELELIEAASLGNLAQVQALIANSLVDVNGKGLNGCTALHWAAGKDHKEVVKMLLAAGADVNAKDVLNDTALHWAAQNGHKEVVDMLLAAGADFNAKNRNNFTALHGAAAYGHKEVVKMLLAARADVNAKDNYYNFTALHEAAEKGHKEVVKMLLLAGADVNAKTVHNITALHWAAKNGHKEVIKMLLAAGAGVNAKAVNNSTALHWAAENGHKEVVEILISFNAEIPQELLVRPWKIFSKQNMVTEAKKNQQALLSSYNFKVIAKLLSKGSYANAAVRERVRIKREQLLQAVKKDNVKKVRALLKEGFSLNTCGKDGNTLIHLAIMHNSQQVLGLLLSLYTKQDNNNLWSRKNKLGLTPVEIAVSQGNVELLKSLLTTQEPENSALQESKAWFATDIEIIPDTKDINCTIM